MKIEGTLIYPDGTSKEVIYNTDIETIYLPHGYTLNITGEMKNQKIEFDNDELLIWWKP